MNESIKIIPLGGMGNVTKNMFVYETQTEILIIDCGIGFPGPDLPGIDLLLPDITYLEDKQEKIVGMILTHAHDDHIAGLPYIVPQLKPFPIYASKLTAGFALDRCKDFNINLQIQELPDYEIKIGSFSVLPIKVTHSVPDARHFAISTSAGTIYHGSDFKFDPNPVDGVISDFEKIKQIGEKGVLALLSDALRSERKGQSLSESLLKETFESEIENTKGKFIVTLMSSNIHRIQQAVSVASAHGRSIAFLGRSVEQNVKTAQKLGFLKLPSNIVNKKQIEKVDPKSLCVIVAGSQGQIGSSLERAASGQHDLINISPEDKVVFATEPIPGNEIRVFNAVDNIAKIGAEIAYSEASEDTFHVSGHANADEIIKLINLTKPKFLIPIGGSYRHLVHYKKIAVDLGYKKDQVFVLKNGEIIELTHESASLAEKVKLKDVLVDGTGIGDVGSAVLSERKKMAESGIVVIVLVVSKQSSKIIGSPEIISRGFVYMKQSKKLISQITSSVQQKLPSRINLKEWPNKKKEIEKHIQSLIYKQTKRNPFVLPVVKQV